MKHTGRLPCLLFAAVLLSAALPAPARAQVTPGHVTGVGGIFVKSSDPKALAAWYRDVLGLTLESWGGSLLKYDAPGHPRQVVWMAFSNATAGGYFDPSQREFMLDFAVDDLAAFLTKLRAKNVKILKEAMDANGKFAYIMDPDGTKIELFQPNATP